MNFLYKTKAVVSIYRVSCLFPSRYYSQPAVAEKDKSRQWPDLEEICKSAKVPEYFNFASDVFDKQVVRKPGHNALWFDDNKVDKKFSYSQVKKESIRSALAIKSVLDPRAIPNNSLKNPPIIVTLLPRVPEWWFIYLGSIRLGTIFSPGTIQLTPEDIKFRLEVSRAEIIITDQENQEKVEEAYHRLDKSKKGIEFLKKIVVDSPNQENQPLKSDWLSYSSLLDKVSDKEILEFRDAQTKSDSLAQAFFTSGTTGKPKMVAHPQVSYGIGHWKTVKVLDYQEEDVIWCPADTGWALSSYCCFFAPWMVGSTVYVNQSQRIETQTILKVLRTKPISNFIVPPTLYKAIMQIKDEQSYNFPSLRRCFAAGEALNADTVKQWHERTGLTINQAYGQTEMTGMGGRAPQKENSFGDPSAEYDLRIINNKGEECPPGKEGNFALKVKPIYPVGLFTGYLTEGTDGPIWDKEKNDSCFVGDHYITGDRGYKDEDGNFFYTSRADDVINSAGYRIGPFEVESAIQTHPSVLESAVVASPDSLRGEVVKAFIVLIDEVKYRKDLDKRKLAKEIQEHVKTQTAPYKYPRKVEFVDSLPKTISGKILRRELKMHEFS